jgi:hypothetical protein
VWDVNKRALVVGSVVLALGVGFAFGWLSHQGGLPSAAPTPTASHAVSASPEVGTSLRVVPVPNLVGVPLRKAEVGLKALRLNSHVVSGAVASSSGTDVLKQQPLAGTEVERGTTIQLYLS